MKIVVRAPAEQDVDSWLELGWRAAPDFARLEREHADFRAALVSAGAEVLEARGEPGNLDSIYVYDPVLITQGGRAILLNPGKTGRRGEPAALMPDLEAAGITIAGRLGDGELAEGGDTIWLDESTLLVGRTYRTNDAGIAALRRALPGVEVRAFDLPHHRGSSEILHLRSLLNPVAADLMVAYLPLLPVPLVELLDDREVRLVEVPDEEFETMGPNVLGLDNGRKALALAGNDETRRQLEAAGVEVLVYDGDEISRKGDGGPTCLTLPLSLN
jgi:N-dimethylarginine dimethylaminohydrolase